MQKLRYGRLIAGLAALALVIGAAWLVLEYLVQRWSHFLRQPAKVDSPMQRTDHHEDAETVFG